MGKQELQEYIWWMGEAPYRCDDVFEFLPELRNNKTNLFIDEDWNIEVVPKNTKRITSIIAIYNSLTLEHGHVEELYEKGDLVIVKKEYKEAIIDGSAKELYNDPFEDANVYRVIFRDNSSIKTKSWFYDKDLKLIREGLHDELERIKKERSI